MIKIRISILLLVISFFALPALSQSIKGYTKEEIAEFSEKVEDQVRFLEYLLNTVGDAETPARDKDVVIRESYLKIFRDENVQVEDDLILDRKVVINKDVTSYMKDIEFFFQDADFKFKVREVKPGQKDNGEVFFLVSLDRTLTATQNSGEEIEDTKDRFIEINLEENSQELKIASIYTTKLSRDEELLEWWELLDVHWKSYFTNRFELTEYDSIDLDLIYRFVGVDSLDISGTDSLLDLSPISSMRELKFVDLSDTQIDSLAPISNVTFLEVLDISNTPAKDIQFIKYSDRLKFLDISNTSVSDISELVNLESLEELRAENTPVMSFSVLNEFESLKKLNLKNSGFNNAENIGKLGNLEELDLSQNFLINFSQLEGLQSLRYLDLSQSNIQDLSPLEKMDELLEVDLTKTEISDLSPLDGKEKLSKILADETKLSPASADNFMRANPEILLIHHVKDLTAWWERLSDPWKDALRKNNSNLQGDNPGIEVLTETIGLETLDLSGKGIESLNPITRFVKLEEINFSDNEVKELLPLSEVRTLKRIRGENTSIEDLEGIKDNEEIINLHFDGSPIKSILPVLDLPNLDQISVNDGDFFLEEVPEILIQRPNLVIIYRQDELNEWWFDLDDEWRRVLARKFEVKGDPSSRKLHEMTSVASLSFNQTGIDELSPILKFNNLRSLEIFDAPVASIQPIANLEYLKRLKLSQIPVVDFLPISNFFNLEELDISNTGIESLEPLSNLSGLKYLNLSGTNLKNLKGLEGLISLEELDVASTNLRSLRPIEGLTGLKKLSCFNTRLSSRSVDSFKSKLPDCEVRYY